MELPERKIFTVSELTEEIKHLLEHEYPSVWVQGEISNFRPAPSGHFYFTLKDEHAQVRCVMFKPQNRFLKFRPESGLEVVAWGRVSVYSPRGEYQLILDTLEPRGIGSLMLAFEQLRDKLAAEGLFDEDRKRKLPPFPKTIGLVTSRKGAAVRDMIRIATRRSPGIHILLSSTSVQGDRAPDEIVAALDRVRKAEDVDVIIIGRGGGAIEDLWAFNDEKVVRAVAECPLPIVSAVGHETDFTLTDFAADMRASTPSSAAEMVVMDRRDLQESVLHLVARLRSCVTSALDKYSRIAHETLKRLYDPRRKIEERRQRLDELTARLGLGMRRRLTALKREAEAAAQRLRPEYLRKQVQWGREECGVLSTRLERSAQERLREARTNVASLASRLDALSPLGVLSRGYSITTRSSTGTVVKEATSVETGEDLRIRLHRGELECTVTGRSPAEN